MGTLFAPATARSCARRGTTTPTPTTAPTTAPAPRTQMAARSSLSTRLSPARGNLLVGAAPPRGVTCYARRRGAGKSVVCNKTVVAKEGREDQVQELCAAYADDMKKSASGVISFECTKDTHDKQQFHFWERYKNTACFNDNLSSEATQGFLEALSDHLEKPVGISLFEYADGKLGSACVEIGPKGEGGLDDATGANKYGGGARYEQTSA